MIIAIFWIFSLDKLTEEFDCFLILFSFSVSNISEIADVSEVEIDDFVKFEDCEKSEIFFSFFECWKKSNMFFFSYERSKTRMIRKTKQIKQNRQNFSASELENLIYLKSDFLNEYEIWINSVTVRDFSFWFSPNADFRKRDRIRWISQFRNFSTMSVRLRLKNFWQKRNYSLLKRRKMKQMKKNNEKNNDSSKKCRIKKICSKK